MIHEDIVICEGCGAEITHIVCGPNFGENDPDYRICENCIDERDADLDDFEARLRDMQGSTLTPVIAVLAIFTTAAVLVAQSGLLHAVLARLAEVR